MIDVGEEGVDRLLGDGGQGLVAVACTVQKQENMCTDSISKRPSGVSGTCQSA